MSLKTTPATPSSSSSSSPAAAAGVVVAAAAESLEPGNGSSALNLVDQGTVFMLTVCTGLALITLLCFLIRRTMKARRKRVQVASLRKEKVKKTFSRFSQVDEELTVYHQEDDLELLQRYSRESLNRPTTVPVVLPRTVSSGRPDKPYLETDM